MEACLPALLAGLHEHHGPVVILVDEFDKPLMDAAEDPERFAEAQEVLSRFSAILQAESSRLRLCLSEWGASDRNLHAGSLEGSDL